MLLVLKSAKSELRYLSSSFLVVGDLLFVACKGQSSAHMSSRYFHTENNDLVIFLGDRISSLAK